MAIALVASVKAGSSGGAAVTTGAINTTGANLIVLAVGYYNASSPAISDNKSNTYTALTDWNSDAQQDGCRMYYRVAPTVGSGHTFTNSTGNYSAITVLAFSGAHASPFVQESGVGSTGSVTSLQPGSLTPPEDACLLVAALSLRDIGSTSDAASINSSFTKQQEQVGSSGNHLHCAIAYQIQTTATARNPTWSWTNADNCATAMASFKAAAGAASIVRQMLQHAH